MSEILNVTSDIASEKFYSQYAKQSQEQAAKNAQQVKQDPSTTGVQWAANQTVAQSQAAQAAAQANNGAKPVAEGKMAATSNNVEIAQPSLEDVAVLSTSVSMSEESVSAPKPGIVRTALAGALNMKALEESYREHFKKSKSHNMLLERFMSNVKFSAVKTLMSLLGVSAAEQAKIQSEVKDQALKEIDSKLRNDWAYTKSMLEITMG
jgi:hypothetical protein